MATSTEIREQREDEIDLAELFSILWRKKYWIVGFIFVVCLATTVYALKLNNIYESKALLKPSQTDNNSFPGNGSGLSGLANMVGIGSLSGGNVSAFSSMNAILFSDSFLIDVVNHGGFAAKVIHDYEKESKKESFKRDVNYLIAKSLKEDIRFTQDKETNIIQLSYRHKNRLFARQFVDELLIALSNRFKAVELANIQSQIDSYKAEIDKTTDIVLKNKLADIVAGYIQSRVIAQAQQYYGFNLIVKPVVPEERNNVEPKRLIMLAAAFLISLSVSVLSVLFYDYLNRVKSVS